MKKIVLMLWGVCMTLSCYTQETNCLFPVSGVNYCHDWAYIGDGSGLHANHFAIPDFGDASPCSRAS